MNGSLLRATPHALLGPRFTALPPLSLYVHIPVVRAQMPLLRFQFA